MSIVFYRCFMTISSLQNVRVWHNPNYVEMAFCGTGVHNLLGDFRGKRDSNLKTH